MSTRNRPTPSPSPAVCIDADLQSLIPPLSSDEQEQLRVNLRADGCRDPLVVWQTGQQQVLLDWHHQYDICRTEGIPFTVVVAERVTTRQEAIAWIVENQLGRRNLTPEQASYLRGKRYHGEKATVPNPEGRNQYRAGEVVPQNEGQATAERLAHDYKVSRATIERDARFADAVDTLATIGGKDFRHKVLSHEVPLTKQKVIKLAQTAEEHPERAKAIIDAMGRGEDSEEAIEAERVVGPDDLTRVRRFLRQPTTAQSREVASSLPHEVALWALEQTATNLASWPEAAHRHQINSWGKHLLRLVKELRVTLGQRAD